MAIKIVAANGNLVIVDTPASWDSYDLITQKLVFKNNKKSNPLWLEAAVAKWGYEYVSVIADGIDDLARIAGHDILDR